jgi:putative hemolysin
VSAPVAEALAVHSPQRVARVMVPVINLLSIIVYPVGKLLASLSTFILRFLKLPMESDGSVSEEELRLIVAGADRSGSIEKYESQIIKNVLDMEETAVRNVMCPRVDVVALEANSSLTDLLAEESKTHYSRMPIFDGTIDNIVGVVLAKSLLKYLNSDNGGALDATTVAEIMDPAFFVPESMSVWTVLEEMRKRRLHMAIVVDEYGGTAGLVSLEDIIEEVVGEIYDEDDDVEADTREIEETGDGAFTIDGQAELEKVGDALRLNLTEDDLRDYGTISGFLCARMGGIPEVGDLIVCDRVRFTVLEADDRRVLSVGGQLLSEAEAADLAAVEADAGGEAAASGGSDDVLSSLSWSNGDGPGGAGNSGSNGVPFAPTPPAPRAAGGGDASGLKWMDRLGAGEPPMRPSLGRESDDGAP